MAKMLDPSEVDFTRSRGDAWFNREWLNGAPWLLTSGEDFTAKPETIRTRLYSEAAKQGLASRAKVLGNGDVIFQTYTRTPEQEAAARAATEKRNATRAANAAGASPSKGKKNAS